MLILAEEKQEDSKENNCDSANNSSNNSSFSTAWITYQSKKIVLHTLESVEVKSMETRTEYVTTLQQTIVMLPEGLDSVTQGWG